MAHTNESERIDSLRSVPLFAECSDESLRRILALAAEFEVERGHVLIQADQPASGLFIIEDGRVTVEVPGRKVELGPGDFFGELGILDEHGLRSTRVSAATHLRCVAIGRDDFVKLLESEPKMAITLLRVLARRLSAAVHR